MGRKTFISLLVLLLCLSLGFSMTAMARDPAKMDTGSQYPVRDPAKMYIRSQYPLVLVDTDEIKAEMEKARQLAGDDFYFIQLQRLQCSDVDEYNTAVSTPGNNVADANNPYRWRDIPAVPTKVFDNVYYVGGYGVGGWLIDTGDGYILLDAMYNYALDTILLPNMAKLGLDPAKVKYILITHGSGPAADHGGGVKYFNDNFRTKVVMSGPERDRSITSCTNSGLPPDCWVKPEDFIVGTDGQTLTLGNTTITMVYTPRSTAGGGLSYFIPVKIKGKPHMWATYGNTGINGPLPNIQVYLDSMAKFFTYVDDLKPDIAISSHPYVDGSLRRMGLIRECQDKRGRQDVCGPRNPFLLGQEGARRYFDIMNQCAVVRYEREAAGLPANGLDIPVFPPW